MEPVQTRLKGQSSRPMLFGLGLLLLVGCTDKTMRLQSPEAFETAVADVRLVSDVSVPYGGHPLEVESVVLVGGLQNTGSDPPPSPERSVLIKEMQRREVAEPSRVLASPTTSPAIARGYLRPGIQKGERFDVEIFVPRECDTTSLRDGVMYQTRMCEHAVLEGRVREGRDLAIAKGPILVDPMADSERDQAELRRGVVLGGGIALKSRPLGLMLKPDEKDVRTSARIGVAINRRFHITNKGIKSGVAKPKTDGYVELAHHPRYKDNLERYLRVVRNIPLREDDTQRHLRLQLLERQLRDPLTSANAAIRLEAIGRDAADVLKKGLASSSPEVRFYASESLAYLDDESAAPVLAEAARTEPAFRGLALAALGAMDEPAARDELVKLMDAPSAETRYGAFRALWSMNENDPAVRGETLGGKFSLHVVRSQGPAMVHVTRSMRPEIVLFGPDLVLRTPLVLDAGKHIHVNAGDDGQVLVSRFAPGEEDRELKVSGRLGDVVRAIVDLGGTYPDVVQALAQAKATHSLDCRFEMDALPARNRRYEPSRNSVARRSGDGAVDRSVTELAAAGTQHEVSQPGNDDPDTAHADVADPDAADPDTADLDTAYPDTAYPDTAYPDTAYPDTTDKRPVQTSRRSSKISAAGSDSSWPLPRYVGKIFKRTRN